MDIRQCKSYARTQRVAKINPAKVVVAFELLHIKMSCIFKERENRMKMGFIKNKIKILKRRKEKRKWKKAKFFFKVRHNLKGCFGLYKIIREADMKIFKRAFSTGIFSDENT